MDKHFDISANNISALILARKGSKGIPSKNMVELDGVPLIAKCINIVKESECFKDIWVSTDDENVALISEGLGASIHSRAAYTATDSSPSILAVQEFLQAHSGIEYLCLVQCTSPFLKAEYLIQGFERFSKREFDSVFSVTRNRSLRWSEELPTVPLNFCLKNRPRRQDFRGELVENGMFYFMYKSFVEEGSLQGGRCCYVEIPSEDSMEIDTQLDLFIAQQMINANLRK